MLPLISPGNVVLSGRNAVWLYDRERVLVVLTWLCCVVLCGFWSMLSTLRRRIAHLNVCRHAVSQRVSSALWHVCACRRTAYCFDDDYV